MRDRQRAQRHRATEEFTLFVAGAAGRLLHTAALLTSEHPSHTPRAERLLSTALARTYASWDRLRDEDPYDRARQELITLFARRAWRYRHPRGGPLGHLTSRERLVLVLRVHERIAEEQAAAYLGWSTERVRAVCVRAVSAARSRPGAGRHQVQWSEARGATAPSPRPPTAGHGRPSPP